MPDSACISLRRVKSDADEEIVEGVSTRGFFRQAGLRGFRFEVCDEAGVLGLVKLDFGGMQGGLLCPLR